MSLSNVFFVMAMVFLIGIASGIFYSGQNETTGSITKASIAECAVDQDLKLRKTSSVARYHVKFVDGERVSITCVSKKTSANLETRSSLVEQALLKPWQRPLIVVF